MTRLFAGGLRSRRGTEARKIGQVSGPSCVGAHSAI
jgi:hypothetical protein